MKYYLKVFVLYSMFATAAVGGTVLYASMFDPKAAELVKLFVDCVVKIILMGH
jgi:hypothetical protein